MQTLRLLNVHHSSRSHHLMFRLHITSVAGKYRAQAEKRIRWREAFVSFSQPSAGEIKYLTLRTGMQKADVHASLEGCSLNDANIFLPLV